MSVSLHKIKLIKKKKTHRSTQWNYCWDNCNAFGDNWNCEDLSIFSNDQVLPGLDARDEKLVNIGGRGNEIAIKKNQIL